MAAAQSGKSDLADFKDQLEVWNQEHDGLDDKTVVDGKTTGNVTHLDAEFLFQDGTTKAVEYQWLEKQGRVKVKTADDTYFGTEDNIKKRNVEPVPEPQPAPSDSELRAQATNQGVLSRTKTISSPPVLKPGTPRTGSSANSSQSWKNGFGVERVTKDKPGFRGEAYCAGAIWTYATQAGVQVWYEFKIADKSPITTPSVKVSFDWSWKAFTTTALGSARALGNVFFNDAYNGRVWSQALFDHGQTYGDYWNGSGSGRATFEKEVRPTGLYRFGLHIDTTASAFYTQIAKSDVSDGNKEVDIGNFDIKWT